MEAAGTEPRRGQTGAGRRSVRPSGGTSGEQSCGWDSEVAWAGVGGVHQFLGRELIDQVAEQGDGAGQIGGMGLGLGLETVVLIGHRP